jgi:hypothetical protein
VNDPDEQTLLVDRMGKITDAMQRFYPLKEASTIETKKDWRQ